MSVYEEFSPTCIGMSGECAILKLQPNRGATVPPSGQTSLPLVTKLAASISENSFALALAKLPFILHFTSCFPQTNSPKDQNKAAKQKESGYDK